MGDEWDTLAAGRQAPDHASPRGFPANGPSYKPAVSGNVEVAPKCVAFVSRASNLVYDDTNGKADAFVHYLSSGEVRRVSVSASCRQSNGHTYDVAVDGRCERIAFTSDASNLALTSTSRSQWKSAVTSRPPSGTKQVYSRFHRRAEVLRRRAQGPNLPRLGHERAGGQP